MHSIEFSLCSLIFEVLQGLYCPIVLWLNFSPITSNSPMLVFHVSCPSLFNVSINCNPSLQSQLDIMETFFIFCDITISHEKIFIFISKYF